MAEANISCITWTDGTLRDGTMAVIEADNGLFWLMVVLQTEMKVKECF
jgi:hypothetical protein